LVACGVRTQSVLRKAAISVHRALWIRTAQGSRHRAGPV